MLLNEWIIISSFIFTLNFRIIFCLGAHINDSLGKSNLNNNTQSANKPKEGQIEIKIQNAGRKKPFVLYVDKTDKLKRLACEIAEEYKCDITKIRLEYVFFIQIFLFYFLSTDIFRSHLLLFRFD